MSQQAKKRKLSIFSSPKDEKEIKKISKLLEEFQRDFCIDGIELEYEDDSPTGIIRCIGSCTYGNKSFSAKGARQLFCSDKVLRHLKAHHSRKGQGSKAKDLDKDAIEKIQNSSAQVIAQAHLSKGFYDNPVVKKRDQEIISAFGGKSGTAEKIGLSRYKCEKLWESSQKEMRVLISRIAPTLIEKGYMSVMIDHKFVNRSIADFQSKVFGIVAVINFNRQSAKYLLSLEPVNTSGNNESTEITSEIFELYDFYSPDEPADAQSATVMEKQAKNILNDLNFAESMQTIDIPIISDSMCVGVAKKFTSVIVTCMAHTLHNVIKGCLKKAADHFSLPSDEWRKVLNFITWARTGYSKEELRKKGISDDKPGNLNDYFFDKIPRADEQMTIFKMKDPGCIFSEPEAKKRAEKIDAFPLAQRHNLIRFASINNHLMCALSWHKKLVELSIDAEDSYLLDDATLPSVPYMRQLQKITAVIVSYIRVVESNDASILDGLLIYEKLLIFIVTELGKVHSLPAEEAKFAVPLFRGCFTKVFHMLFQRCWINGEIIFGREHKRIHDCSKAALYLYYPRLKCSFFRLEAIMKKSEDPFILENLKIMKDIMEDWQDEGISFIKKLSSKFTISEEKEIEEQSPSLFDDSDEIDPALIEEEVLNMHLESQGSSDALSHELQNYEKTTTAMWKETKSLAHQKLRKEEDAKKLLHLMRKAEKGTERKDVMTDSELMAFFWKKNSSKYPVLAKIGTFVRVFYNKLIFKIIKLSKIPSSSSEIERSFAEITRDTQNPQQNRQKCKSVELRRQFMDAEPFKRLAEAALTYENSSINQ